MKKIIDTALVLVLIMLSTDVFSQIKVYPVGSAGSLTNKEGLFYSLPRTLLKVDVIVEMKEEIPGPLHAYAEKYMGLGKVPTLHTSQYQIKEIRVVPIAQPDPDQSYFVQIDRKSKEDKSVVLSLTESGIIKGVNLDQAMDQVDFRRVDENAGSKNDASLFDYFADYNFYKSIDTVARRISIDAANVERFLYNTSWPERDLEQKSKEASEFIAKIRENRFLLLTGYQEINYGEGMVYMDGELKKMEREYMSLFTGRTKKESFLKSFTFIPQKNVVGNQVVFKFSNSEGFLKSNSSRGSNVYIKIISHQNTLFIDRFNRLIAVLEDTNPTGCYYRIPEKVTVQILFDGEVIHESEQLISQYGTVSQIPSLKSSIEFDTQTGMIKRIRLR
ncbi:MAG: DUF4831 family protein [Bacteroidetes bacterium]|nr:DUF4831 family protein [Bacteroidota bacterium]